MRHNREGENHGPSGPRDSVRATIYGRSELQEALREDHARILT
jgi:hypothetical protein